MTRRLKWGRNITTEQALDRIEQLVQSRTAAIRDYRDTRNIEKELSDYRLLILDRERWTDYCDDCSHWAGAMG